jgi:Uma2 family endonuclease
MAVTEKLLTAEEFLHLPEPEGAGKMELWDGRVVIMSPVGRKHGGSARRCAQGLGLFVDEHALGDVEVETGFRLSRNPDTVFAPDVSFIRKDRLGEPDDDGFYPFPPDLAVEIKSPDDSEPEIARKVSRYLAAGCPRVWVGRPRNRTISVHERGKEPRLLRESDVLTSADAGFEVDGLSLRVGDLFR